MKKLILHLGAHRCGSTAIQTMLEDRRAALAKEGVGLVLRRDKENGFLDLRRLHRYKRLNPNWAIKLRQLARQIRRTPFHTLFVSDENMIGTMPGVRGFGFYPYFPKLMDGLSALGDFLDGDAVIEPRLVVRRQDQYIESVYAFRVSRGLTLGFDAFLKTIDLQSLSWLSLLMLLKRLPENMHAKVAVLEAWSTADAARDAAHFLGLPDIGMDHPDRLRGNQRSNKEALLVMLACNRAGIDAEWALSGISLQSPSLEAVLERTGEHVTPHQQAQLKATFAENPVFGFSEPARAAFLACYSDENNAFLNHDMVTGGAALWR